MVGSDPEDDCAFIAGDGEYAIEVVSEIRHQERLEWLAQGRGEEPVEYDCTALLVHEPDNPFDSNAVSVSIEGVRVGYLPPAVAAAMVAAMRGSGIDRATCDAIIEGGWYRSAEDKGDFCVRLDVNADLAPEFIPVAVQAPLPQPVVAAAAAPRPARNTLYDLVVGAAATVGMLVVLGGVWLVVQHGSWFVALAPRMQATLSPSAAPDRTGTALASVPARAARPAQTEAAAVIARPDAPARPLAMPSLATVSDAPQASAVPQRANAVPLPVPKPATALSALGSGPIISGLPPPARAEINSGGALHASAAADADRAAIAGLPSAIAEIEPLPQRSLSVAAPVAEELDPADAAAVFQSALPPIPKPAPPPAASEGDGTPPPDAVAARQPQPTPGAAAAVKREAKPAGNARTRRALTRSRAAKAKSRYPTRYSRKQRRTVQSRQQPVQEEPAPAAAPAPAPPPLAPPFNSMATRMLEGLSKEWQTQAVPSLRRPRQAQ